MQTKCIETSTKELLSKTKAFNVAVRSLSFGKKIIKSWSEPYDELNTIKF